MKGHRRRACHNVDAIAIWNANLPPGSKGIKAAPTGKAGGGTAQQRKAGGGTKGGAPGGKNGAAGKGGAIQGPVVDDMPRDAVPFMQWICPRK